MEERAHGYIYEPIVIDEHWVFGSSTQAAGDILQPDRDWRPYLPTRKEVQDLNGIEPNACTIYGTLNAAQTLIRRKYGEDRDYSNRFLAVISGTDPARGNTPHKVAEALRLQGDCDEAAWTFDGAVDTVAKFYAPVPDRLKALAKEFVAEWRFTHDWVATTPQQLWDALQYSPIGISVYAWVKDGDGLYYKPDPRAPDTHWCAIVYAVYGKYWVVLDSYMDGGELFKKVRWDTPFMQAKRYGIERQADVQSAGWQWFVAFLRSLWPFPVITPAPEVPVKPRETPPAAPESPERTPTPPPAPKESRLEKFCLAIRTHEGWYPGSRSWRNNNPGNCRYSSVGYASIYGKVGKDAQNFAVFRDYATGWRYLQNLVKEKIRKNPRWDFYDFFEVYAPSFENDSKRYAEVVAKACGMEATDAVSSVL